MKQTLLKLTGIFLGAAIVFAFPAIARADGDTPECPASYDGKHYEDRGYGINRKEPTCTEDGSYENIAWCMFCSEILSRETVVIPATGHSWYVAAVTPATCTTDGVITYLCSKCGAAYYETIPATGHTLGIMPARAATCEEEALTEGQYCSTCGEILLYQYSSPALGHDWDEGVVQGDEGGLLHDHDIVFTCSRCGKTHTETAKINSKNFWPTLYNDPIPDEDADIEFPLIITQQPKDLELEWKEGNMGMLTIEVSGGREPYKYKWIMVPGEQNESSLGSSFVDYIEDIGAAIEDGMNLAESFGKAEGGNTGAACAKPAVIGDFTIIDLGNAEIADSTEAAAAKLLDYDLIPGNACVTETQYPELQVEVSSAPCYTAWCIVYDDNGDHVTSETVKIIPKLTIVKQPQDINYDDPEAAFSIGVAYGKEPYTYQWQFLLLDEEFVDIDSPHIDANGPTMRPDSGMDQVRCIVTDSNKNSVISDVAGFFFAPVLEVSGSEDLFIRPGEPAQLSASFHGGVAPYTATWEKWGNGTSYVLTTQTFEEDPADTPVTYDLDSTDGSAYGIYVFTVEDNVGQVKEWTVGVSYRELTILTQPEDGDLNFDGDYEVSIEMGEGTMPFTYSLRYVTHEEIVSETTASSTWTTTLHESDIYYIYVTDANGLHAESRYFCVGDYEVRITSQRDVIDIKDPKRYEMAALLVEGGEGPYTLTWYKMNEDTGAYEAMEDYGEGYWPTVGYGDGWSIDLETEDWARMNTCKTGMYILEATDANNVKGVSKPFMARYAGTKPYIIVEPQDMEFEATSGRSDLTYSLDCLATATGAGEEDLAYLWEYCEEDGSWQKAPLQTLYSRGTQYHSYADYPHQDFYHVNHSRLYRCRVTNMKTGEVTYSRTATVKLLMVCTHYGQGGKDNDVHGEFAGGSWPYSFQIREKYAPFWTEVWSLDGTDGNNRSYSWYDFIQYWKTDDFMEPYYPDEMGQLIINFAGKTYDVAVADTGKEVLESNIYGTVYCHATGIARRYRLPYTIFGEKDTVKGAHDYYHRVYQIMVKDWLGDTCTTPWFRMTSPMTASEEAYNIFFFGICGTDPLTSQSDHSGW